MRAVLTGTQTLAGSVASMIECVRNFDSFTKCGVARSCQAASLHPAELLGIADRKGAIRKGLDADLVLLDDDLNAVCTIIRGKIAWVASDAPDSLKKAAAANGVL